MKKEIEKINVDELGFGLKMLYSIVVTVLIHVPSFLFGRWVKKEQEDITDEMTDQMATEKDPVEQRKIEKKYNKITLHMYLESFLGGLVWGIIVARVVNCFFTDNKHLGK